MKTLVSFTILVLLALPARAQQLRLLQDVIYSQAGGHLIAMDAYLWDWGSLAPAVVYIHGGGWRDGDKKDVPEFLEKGLFDAGISLISINYRLSQQAPHPAQLEDVTRAIQFVRHRARSWHIDPDRMGRDGRIRRGASGLVDRPSRRPQRSRLGRPGRAEVDKSFCDR